MNPVPNELLTATVQAFGTPVRVTAHAEDGAEALLAEVIAPWSDAGFRAVSRAEGGTAVPSSADPADPGQAIPVVDLGSLSRAHLERTGSLLSSRVTLAALEHHRGRHLMFHAAGIANAEGAVVAIIGPSGRGKTTTVRQLAQTYGYVSDETITITPDDRVFPYRKPLSVITEGHADKLQIPPSALGLAPLPKTELRIAGLVLLERAAAGTEESSVEPLPLAEGLVELVQQTSYLVELSDPLRRIAEIADATGGLRRLRVGSPERIAGVAEHLFESGACEAWEQVLPLDAECGAAPYAVTGVVDAIECAEGTAVLTADRRVQVLAGVGPVLWRGICAGEGWDDLEARIRAELGDPPSGTLREAIRAAGAGLVEAGVLRER
ncbi:hypothetical protein JD276_10550 [Leucobacter sp. CSA1]|uniref:Uncharacterized protein n=1 Tax=Leucobacter chromiisoli TaxID=2796471 RepID=A0A934Q9Y0_9MICO|nr:hypothetical protein [Leucobacter chromiisoli]MBK0419472.1 hypothetical protein [Leucobacter chromiisoli]